MKSKKQKFKTKRLERHDLAFKKNSFLAALIRNEGVVTKTCREVGIHRMTYYAWKEKDKKFLQALEKIREIDIDNIEDAFRDLIKERNPQSVIFGLKTRAKHRGYVERTEIHHFGDQGINITFDEPSNKREEIDIESEEIEN